MKIIFCDNSLRELLNFREDIIRYYLSKGDEVTLVAPKNCNLDIKGDSLKLIPLTIQRSGMNPIKDLKYFMSLYRIYRCEKPDYIFHYTIKPNIYGSLAAILNSIPSTAMIAGLGYVFSSNDIRAKVGRFLYRFAMRFPEHVFVLNQHNKNLVVEKHIAKEKQVILLRCGEGVNLKKYE